MCVTVFTYRRRIDTTDVTINQPGVSYNRAVASGLNRRKPVLFDFSLAVFEERARIP